MRRTVVLSSDAVRQFRKLPAADRARLRDAMETRLQSDDALVETQNRFRLRRPSEAAEFELRVGELRAFYRVARREVQVVLIGRKRGNALLIEGKRFIL